MSSHNLSLDHFPGINPNGKKDQDKTKEELIQELEIMRGVAKSNRSSRIMLDEMYQFVALLDNKGNLLDVNEPALHGGGMIRSNILGTPFWDCRWWAVNDTSMDDCKRAVQRAAAGEFIRYECDIFGKSAGTETITIDFSLMPLFDENGAVKLILPEGRNITEKKQAEDEIARKNNELRQLYEKIKELDELKTQFFANVSHELRTPLTLISHPTEKLLKDPTIPSEAKKLLEVVARNTRGLLKHVNNLLDISKLEAGKMNVNYSMADIGKTINTIALCFELLAKDKKLEYTINSPKEGTLMAAIDRDKIERAVTNLISNAFKFTPAGGKIRISVEASELNQSPAFLVTVADTGPGVPEDQYEVIFERFRQVDGSSTRRHGGTGLGLSIVKEFVQLHGGTVQVTSQKEGTGAVFLIKIPVSPKIDELAHKTTISDANVSSKMPPQQQAQFLMTPPKDTAADGEALSLEDQELMHMIKEKEDEISHLDTMGSKFDTETTARQAAEELEEREGFAPMITDEAKPSVLVVEDNVEMNRFIAELLCKPYSVYTAFNGREALDKLQAHTPDLILTDCMMPIMSGDEMVEEIRKDPQYDNIPIILLTAKADDNLRVRLLTNGVADYVNKPFSAEELTARVNNIMAMKKAKDYLQQELCIANTDLVELVNQLTARKRELQVLVTELEKERVLLDRANRSKDEFLMNLSHELRTPLNGIFGWSQLLRFDGNISTDVRRGLESIERCAHAQNQLVNDLLDMSLVISGKFSLSNEVVDIREVIKMAAETFINKNSSRIAVEVGDHPLIVSGDPVRLEQSIWNLVSNAIKFSNQGGNIIVKASMPNQALPLTLPPGVCGQSEEKLSLLRNHASGKNWCLVTIADQGCGITPDFLPHVFERFRQADNSSTRGHGGLGLGLSIVNNIVELHNGYLFAFSEGEGKGSTFTIILPINNGKDIISTHEAGKNPLKRNRSDHFYGSPPLSSANDSPPEDALMTKVLTTSPVNSCLKGLKIYVIDDQEDTVKLFSSMLNKMGAFVSTFLSSASCYETFSTGDSVSRPDVILTDITMPDEDGYTLVSRIRALEHEINSPPIPIVALTASSDKAKIAKTGFDLYVSKPVNFYELSNSIHNLLNGNNNGNGNGNRNGNGNGKNNNHNLSQTLNKEVNNNNNNQEEIEEDQEQMRQVKKKK